MEGLALGRDGWKAGLLEGGMVLGRDGWREGWLFKGWFKVGFDGKRACRMKG